MSQKSGGQALVYSVARAARLLGLSEEALRGHLARGTGPPVRRLSPRRLLILASEFHAWLDALQSVSRPRLRAEPEEPLEVDLGEGADA